MNLRAHRLTTLRLIFIGWRSVFEVAGLLIKKIRKFLPARAFGPSVIVVSLTLMFSQTASIAGFGKSLLLAQQSVATGNAESSRDELSIAQAKKYMLSLINRDRKSQGLKEVDYDETAEKAGDLHSSEMARLGYLSHWDTAGRKPDQRYCSVGGTGFVLENSHIEFAGFSDEQPPKNAEFKIDPTATLSRKTIEDIESGFFNEQPPNDGHRRNILDPDHTSVGIGLSVAKYGDNSRVTCAQEFIHSYGNVEAMPVSVNAGESFVVKGSLDPGLRLSSLDLFWEELPQPMTLKQLDETHSYGPPMMRVQTYFPGAPGADNLSVNDNGGKLEFSCRFDTQKTVWKPGLYYVYVWARTPDQNRLKPLLVASKTIEVR